MRRPVNKLMQMFALFSRLGVSNKEAFKKKMASKEKLGSLSMFAEGVNPNTLSYKREKGKWKCRK
jgi:ABC-type Fe3+/spermidine/putrescine transport system ATPase subunit